MLSGTHNRMKNKAKSGQDWSVQLGCSLVFACILLGSRTVSGAEKVHFDIAEGHAEDSILLFVRQAGLQVVFPADVVAGTITAPVRGEFTPGAALRQMLKKTDLSFSFVNDRTVAIARNSSPHTQVRRLASDSAVSEADSGSSYASDSSVANATGGDSGLESQPGYRDRANRILEEIVVTGTHLRGVEPSSSPLTIYDRTFIERSGASSIGELMRKIPQNLASLDGGVANSGPASTGGISQNGGNAFMGTGVNLRGLGPNSTLVLLNGQRLTSAGTVGGFTDIAGIPLSAIERIEVISDGASAIYGSDAVAGVVNIILRKEFAGAETALLYSDTADGGARKVHGSQLFGGSWSSGNVMLNYEHQHADALMSTQRSFVPPVPLPKTLYPRQIGDSLLIAGEQEVFESAKVALQASYSDREYERDQVAALALSPTTAHESGEAQQKSASATFSRRFLGTWQGDVSANYSSIDQRSATQVGNGTPTSLAIRTRLSGVDARADGDLFSVRGNPIKVAAGIGVRREELWSSTLPGFDKLQRYVRTAYAEALLPLIGESDRIPWVRKLDLSLAGRYERYDDAGSSTDPKIGVVWTPIEGFRIRASRSSSFKAPPLSQTLFQPAYAVFAYPDASAPDRVTTTLVDLSSGNPNLRPEDAESTSIGFDITPPQVPGLRVQATYFQTDYRERIAQPPLVGALALMWSQTETLAPFINRSPSLAEVQEIFSSGAIVFNQPGATPERIEAMFDNRRQNIASTEQSGIELSLTGRIATRYGDVDLSLDGTYLLKMDFQAANTTPRVDVLGTLGQPVDTRLRGGVSWQGSRLSSSVIANYWGKYENSLFTPSTEISSWTTLDFQLGYRSASDSRSVLVRNWTVLLDVQNLANRRPPTVSIPASLQTFLNSGPGYDYANADPLGRTISLQVRRTW